ncbi:MAG: hypothetical protein JRN15_23280, partial [Nitrososphaerota archaeon]|nr:hypothetical protein [Nitrososphaerota archaeon]
VIQNVSSCLKSYVSSMLDQSYISPSKFSKEAYSLISHLQPNDTSALKARWPSSSETEPLAALIAD